MEKEKTPEEIAKEKENSRDYALKNLEAPNLVDVATSYLVDEDKNYGETDNSVMEQFKYFPAFNSGTKALNAKGEEYDLVQNSLIASREEGKRYSGNISERKIMKDCAEILFRAFHNITVKDAMKLMGSDAKINPQFNDVYVGDLNPQLSEEEFEKLSKTEQASFKESAKIYQNLVGGYQVYLTRTKVSEALAESVKQIPKGLEAILTTPEKKA